MSILGISPAHLAYMGKSKAVYNTNTVLPSTQSDSSSSAQNTNKNAINDTVLISLEAKEMYIKDKLKEQEEAKDNSKTNNLTDSDKKLTPDEKKDVEKLQATDAEVKAHEKAHENAASGISASTPSYTYKVGPDGNKYAVAGDVHVSYKSTGDAEADAKKAKAMESSALAPNQPSSQDLLVAQKASASETETKSQKTEQQQNNNSQISDEITNS